MTGVVIVVRAVEDAPEFERLATAAGLDWSSFVLPRFYHVEGVTPQTFPFPDWSGIEIIERDDVLARGEQTIVIPEGTGGEWPLVRHTSRAPPWDNDGLRLPIEIEWTPPVRQGTGVDIYFVDTGIELLHPEFGGRATIVYEFTSTGGIGDDNGHGTAVAAAAAGATCGFARDALLWSCKGLSAENTGTAVNLLNAMGAALAHYEARTVTHPGRPAICNNSWSSTANLYGAAALDMMNAGMIVVAAAANDREHLAVAPRYPACTPGVINCGGTQLGDVAYNTGTSGSNYGLEVDILAGGQAIRSATLRSLGVGDYRIWSGTSFASPYVAGAAACMLQGHVRPDSYLEQQAVGVFIYEQATFGYYVPSPPQVPMTPAILYLDPDVPFQQIPGLESAGLWADRGVLEIVGRAPRVGSDVEIEVEPGELEIEGRAPIVTAGQLVNVAEGVLEIVGSSPGIFTETAAIGSELAVVVLGEVIPAARASQMAVTVLAEIVPEVRASQAVVIALADGSPCVTQRAQIWKITRRDGEVFRYTSLDQDLRWGGQVYRSCRSLNPSASENASTLGSVGNIELDGIIDDDGISEADLYGGLFDDAYVTVDLVAWGADAESPRRLASGWTGELSQGETGFRMEVLGAGSRLGQQALVQMVTPGCRWVFGSAECGVDIEALAIGGAVTAVSSRGRFLALLDGVEGGLQWQNGTVRWTTGANVGQTVEVKTVDFDTGDIVLWASPSYLPQAGDQFDLLPGCDKVRDGGCTVYANVINFGGFPDVPGSDSLLETPDAKY